MRKGESAAVHSWKGLTEFPRLDDRESRERIWENKRQSLIAAGVLKPDLSPTEIRAIDMQLAIAGIVTLTEHSAGVRDWGCGTSETVREPIKVRLQGTPRHLQVIRQYRRKFSR